MAKDFLRRSAFLQERGFGRTADNVSMAAGRLTFDSTVANSYVASAMADFFRQRLLEARMTFTLETVMSHPGKVTLLNEAQRLGYRTYLYYVATEDPEINISRVRSRASRGGHDVPEGKIVSRYYASLDLLREAVRYSNRAYIFDNSKQGQEKTWLAEVTEGKELEMKADQMPAWFKRALFDKTSPLRFPVI
jgi:predicted ABC-type ATPase